MPVRPFIDTLRDLECGHLLDELSDVQQEVVAAISDTDKAGEITIKLTFKPEGNGQLTIKADIKKKVPQLARGTSLFFVTPDRNLQREDPRQQNLQLRAVEPAAPAELRTVNG